MQLKVNWKETGADIETLKNVISDLDEHTHVKRVHALDFDLLSFKEITKDGYVRCFKLDEVNIREFEDGKPISTVRLPVNKFDSQLLAETISTTKLFMVVWDKDSPTIMHVSEVAMFTFLQRGGLGGEIASKLNTLSRNVFFAEALSHNVGNMSIVYRDGDESDKVIFAVMGCRYERIPQKLVVDTVLSLENSKGAECNYWTIDHEYTNVSLTFPKLAEEMQQTYGIATDCVPAIIMITSDVGLACFDAVAGYMIDGKNFIITGQIKRKHMGEVDENALAEELEDTLLADVRKLPETLAYLMNKPVSDPKDLIIRIWDDYLSKIPGFVRKNIPLKNMMLKEVEDLQVMSGYDIAMMFLTLEEQLIGLNDSSLHKLRIACAKIPYKIKRILEAIEVVEAATPVSLLPYFKEESKENAI